MEYNKIKKEAKKNLKHNYFKNVIVVFVCLWLLSGGFGFSTKNILNTNLSDIRAIETMKQQGKTNSEIIDDLFEKMKREMTGQQKLSKKYTNGVLSYIINQVTSSYSAVFSVLNGINEFLGGKGSIAMVIIASNFVLILFRSFFVSVVEVGKNRYFLEQRRYLKTGIERVLYPYKKKKTLHLAMILFLKNIYLFLWSFTIVGFFVKYYEYKMIPYLLAENPSRSFREVFSLSKKMSDGHKLEFFKLDLSLLLYKVLGILTFNLTNIFFTNIYEETLYTEVYMNLKRTKNFSKELGNDSLLERDNYVDSEYPEEKHKSVFSIDFLKNYSIDSYLLFFFTFSFVGWIWEVVLHLIQNGTFVNRGTLYGPWLPIYGYGGLAILILLKKWQKEPFKLFIAAVILCGIIEYGTAWYLETFKHLKYWDYSGYFLNLHGRICLEGLIVFGLGGCGFTYLFAPILDKYYQKISEKVRIFLIVVLLIAFAFDMAYSSFITPNTGEGITTEVKETEKIP